ncbi:MAG: transposase [Candidatus Accumulibacter sp.]|nr:transposase [Accumulibacter sp.]
MQIGDSETFVTWDEAFRWLKGRGLKCVMFVVSDEYGGLTRAMAKHFQGATWQRCQVHLMRKPAVAQPGQGARRGRQCGQAGAAGSGPRGSPTADLAEPGQRVANPGHRRLPFVEPQDVAQWHAHRRSDPDADGGAGIDPDSGQVGLGLRAGTDGHHWRAVGGLGQRRRQNAAQDGSQAGDTACAAPRFATLIGSATRADVVGQVLSTKPSS